MNDNERDVELIDYIEVVLRYKWLIGLVTVACMLGAHFRPIAPNWYAARSLIYVAPQSSSGEARGTEMELPSLSPAFYKKIAEADQVRLIIAELQSAMEDSLGIAPAPVGMQVGIVETAGIQLEVRSTVPALPVGLVNAWTDTFMVLSEGLSASELGSIYKSVQAQFETASSRLKQAEDALETFDESSALPVLMARSGASMRQDSLLQTEILSKQQFLDSESDRLARAQAVVASVEQNGVPIHRMTTAQLEALSTSRLQPLASQLLNSMRQRNALENELRTLEADGLDHIAQLAGLHQSENQPRAASFQSAIDSYKVSIERARHTLLDYRDSLRGVETALYLEPENPGSSGNTSGGQSWRQADDKSLNALRITPDTPNRAHLFLQADRARYRVAIATAETRLKEGPAIIALLESGGMESLQALRNLQETNDRARGALRDQLDLVESIHVEASNRYESAKRLAGPLGRDVDALSHEIQDMTGRMSGLRQSAADVTGRLQRLRLERDRLVRSHETLSATYARFAQLTEEARIAAQIASGNLRVITRAVTPVGEGVPSSNKVPLAGAAGFALAVFIAFFYEYMSKARAASASRVTRG